MKTLPNREALRNGHRVFSRISLLLVCFQVSISLSLAQSVITTYAGGAVPTSAIGVISPNIVYPTSVILDRTGGFYFTSGSRVRRVDAAGTLMVIAGNGTNGFSGDGGPATLAQLSRTNGVALDGNGNLYIADSDNNRIRKVTPGGIISTVAGGGTGELGDGGPAIAAHLSGPNGVALDGSGNLFIADSNNNRIRKVTPDGVISTVAGGGTGELGDGGPAISAHLSNPNGVGLDGSGNLFIADTDNNRIRKVTPDGIINTVAGDGRADWGTNGVPATSSPLWHPHGVAIDGSGNILIADSDSNRIRKVAPSGIITSLGGFAFNNSAEGFIWHPLGVAVDEGGNAYVAESRANRIRKITPAGIMTVLAANGTDGFSGDGGAATSAQLKNPGGIAVDDAGNLFIADTGNNRIRKVNATGIMNTFAGNGTNAFSGDGGPALSASIASPSAVAVDTVGNVLLTSLNLFDDRIRKVNSAGTISNFGNARFWYFFSYEFVASEEVCIAGFAVDAEGNLFVAETTSNTIWKVTPGGSISPVVATFGGFGGDGGPAISAQLLAPNGLAVDAEGNLFIADSGNNRIRKITPDGIISTVAGIGTAGFGGDGGPATSAQLWYPLAIAVDKGGNLFIADSHNNRIRKVNPAGIISTVAGDGISGFSGDGGPPASAEISYPTGIAVDTSGNLFISDFGNNRIRKVSTIQTVPTLSDIFPNLGVPGAAVKATLIGSSFANLLTIDAGAGVAVSDVTVTSNSTATATLTIAPNAAPGARNVTVTTNLGKSGSVVFTVVPPFPDLTITSSHSGNFAVGFNGIYTVDVRNVGEAATTGSITMIDALPLGLTFVSGVGNGWSCAPSVRDVSCTTAGSLAAGASTTLTLTVAVGSDVAFAFNLTHAPSVSTVGDLIPSNNSALDPTVVARLTPSLLIFQMVTGKQATVGITLPLFPFDVTGTMTLSFSPEAVIPVDDPAIQFANGSREVSFTIPANSNQAQFAGNSLPAPIGFQVGTVAGTFTFSATLRTGAAQLTISSTRRIPWQAPALQDIKTDTRSGLVAVMTLLSTMREVTQLTLKFNTTTAVKVSCGKATGCTTDGGSAIMFDVKSLFETWFSGDTAFGSLSTLRVPLTVPRSIHGSVEVTLSNSRGTSNAMSFPLP